MNAPQPPGLPSTATARKSKRLLFVTNVFPYPLDRGERVRVFKLIEACAQEFEVTFVGPRPGAAALAHIPNFIAHSVLVDVDERGGSDWRVLLHALSSGIGMPFGNLLNFRIQFLRALQGIDLDSFNLIWAERTHIGRLFLAHRSRTIVDFDDVEHVKLAKLMQIQPMSFTRAHNLYRYLIYRSAELRGFREFLRLVVCSVEDRSYLHSRGAGNVCVVPNGAIIPDALRPPRPRAPGAALRAVFLGNMGYQPNVDAVRYFADEVLPATGGIVSSFDVIGPNAPPELTHDYSGRVNFRGYVDDLGAALQEYHVMVAPIRFGSGTKLKVLEAMANGIPLVSTPQGAEGLELVNGESALLASTPQDMVDALARLAESPQLCEQLAAAAYALACSRFSWKSIQDALSKELLGLTRR